MVVLTVLGEARIDAGEARMEPRSARKFALLLYLAAYAGRRVSRGLLQELLFPDVERTKGGHSLREILYDFRRAGVPIDAGGRSCALPAQFVRSDYRALIEANSSKKPFVARP